MTLKTDLKLFKPQKTNVNPYLEYKLLENPFPGYSHIPTDVCTDQETAKAKFVQRLKEFDTSDKCLRINGLSGAGKTNILHYFKRLTDQAKVEGYIQNIYPIYALASGEDYLALHEQVIEQLLERTFDEFISSLRSNTQQIETLKTLFPTAAEVLDVTQTFFGFGGLLFYNLERNKDIFQRWFKGQKSSPQDKRVLGINQDIGSASLAIRYLKGYLDILKHLSICYGVILLIDEFEQIFVSIPRAKQSRYAQDIRHLIDALESQVLFVFATTPEPGDLSKYPAVERRMGEIIGLEPIENIDQARKYIIDYLKAGREAYEQEKEIKLKPSEREDILPLSEDIIRQVYEKIKQQIGDKDVLPGYFLPEMRQVFKELVENGNGKSK
ncbi:MAG: BREX system ATP-binding domain-containing protein [Blastocatellia bacterium]